MKKLWISIFIGAAISAQAVTITSPYSGANVLDGNYAYKWAFGIDLAPNETISSASISFSNVKLTSANSSGKGVLYTDLLNVSSSADQSYWDGDASGDYFDSISSSSRVDIGTKNFNLGQTLSWTYTFTAAQLLALNSFASDGYVAFGFDPDCHYNVGSITFTYVITSKTTSVPDGGQTVLFLGFGLLAVFGVKRLSIIHRLATCRIAR